MQSTDLDKKGGFYDKLNTVQKRVVVDLNTKGALW